MKEEIMKRWLVFLPLIILMAFTLGCQDQQAIAELKEMKAQAQTEEQNKEIGRQLFAAIDENDFDKLSDLMDPELAVHAPGLAEALGRDAIFQAISTHYASFPDWRHVIDDVVAEGEKVTIRLTQYGTQTAEFEGIPATGNEIEVAAMHLVTIADGKVKDWWVMEDYLGQYQQLGMELRPASGS
jgi:predicted ester cyclase